MKYIFLLLPLLLTNCVTTEQESSIDGKVFYLDNGATIVVGYLTTGEGLFPGDFKNGPNREDVQYPEMARRAEIEGTVEVTFDLDENGEIYNARVWRGIGGGCDEAALRIVRNSTYTPAKDGNANPVRAKHSVFIVFKR